MFLTLVRRNNDDALYKWACDLLLNLKSKNLNFTAHYLGFGHWTLKNFNINYLDTDLTIVFCFDYTTEKIRKEIVEYVNQNKKTNIVWIGAEKDPFDHPRIKNIFWPGDLLLQNKEYKLFNNIEKTPSNKKHWISASLGIRPHRIYMASLLKGLGLDTHGDLRIKTVSQMGEKSDLVSEELSKGNNNAPDNIKTLKKYVEEKWKLNSEIKDISIEANVGYEKLIQKPWWGSSIFLYSQYMALGVNENNNALNFDRYLRELYKDKTLEIINETSHGHDPAFITEKTLNAIIGLNFVVINGSARTVQLLEELGWNSCRHIINHDYDNIINPILRCEQAIRLNDRLFYDTEYCNELWQKNLNILIDNSIWAREQLYKQILEDCEKRISSIKINH